MPATPGTIDEIYIMNSSQTVGKELQIIASEMVIMTFEILVSDTSQYPAGQNIAFYGDYIIIPIEFVIAYMSDGNERFQVMYQPDWYYNAQDQELHFPPLPTDITTPFRILITCLVQLRQDDMSSVTLSPNLPPLPFTWVLESEVGIIPADAIPNDGLQITYNNKTTIIKPDNIPPIQMEVYDANGNTIQKYPMDNNPHILNKK